MAIFEQPSACTSHSGDTPRASASSVRRWAASRLALAKPGGAGLLRTAIRSIMDRRWRDPSIRSFLQASREREHILDDAAALLEQRLRFALSLAEDLIGV